MDLKWEAPPPPYGGRSGRRDGYDSIRAALKQRPGEWAVIMEFKPDSDLASTPVSRAQSRRAYITKKQLLGPDAEVVARNGKVYARVVG